MSDTNTAAESRPPDDIAVCPGDDVDRIAEAMNLAAGLCHSEANRWETAHPPTATHWRSIAIRLQGAYLASGVDAAEVERLRAERDGYARGLRLIQGDADPDWDAKFAVVLIENVTLAREVERLREELAGTEAE